MARSTRAESQAHTREQLAVTAKGLFLRDGYKAAREDLAALMAGYAARFGITLPMSPDDAAAVLLSLGIGLGVRRAIDPSIPVDVLTEALRLCFSKESCRTISK